MIGLTAEGAKGTAKAITTKGTKVHKGQNHRS